MNTATLVLRGTDPLVTFLAAAIPGQVVEAQSGRIIYFDRMSVPIQIDAVGAQVVRCTYLHIEAVEPQPDWTLSLGATRIPILLIGLSAIVVNTIEGRPFYSSNDIEALFERVESIDGLSVEVSDIWLPTFLFTQERAARGTVFRLDRRAFGRAFAQVRDGFDVGYWERNRPELLEYSGEETQAFGSWGNRLIAQAREQFPKNGELKLTRRGPDTEWGKYLNPPEEPPPLTL